MTSKLLTHIYIYSWFNSIIACCYRLLTSKLIFPYKCEIGQLSHRCCSREKHKIWSVKHLNGSFYINSLTSESFHISFIVYLHINSMVARVLWLGILIFPQECSIEFFLHHTICKCSALHNNNWCYSQNKSIVVLGTPDEILLLFSTLQLI